MRMRLIASIAQLLLLVGGLVMILGATSAQEPQPPATTTWDWRDATAEEELEYELDRELERRADERARLEDALDALSNAR